MNDAMIDRLIQSHIDWMSNKLKAELVDGQVFIHTPYLDSANDHITIQVSEQGNGTLVLSDYGNTLSDLWLWGLPAKQGKRGELLKDILAGFDVVETQGHLQMQTSIDRFPEDMLYFIQCLTTIYDLIYTRTEEVQDAFLSVVEHWFAEFAASHSLRCSSHVVMEGISGDPVHMDFVVARNGTKRYVKVIKDHHSSISSAFLAFSDLRTDNGNGTKDKIGIWNDTGERRIRSNSDAKMRRVCNTTHWEIRNEELVSMLP